MRMCSHEDRFLPGVYYALRDELSWEETQRIRASLAIINEDRAEYNEWYAKNAERVRKHASAQDTKSNPSQLTLADYKRELDGQRKGLANAQADMRKHRGALLQELTAAEGLLQPEQVVFLEQVVEIHAGKIERIEAAINDFVSAPGANVSID